MAKDFFELPVLPALKRLDPKRRERGMLTIREALRGRGVRPSIDIDLPELTEDASAELVPDRIRTLSAIYFAAMLEELKFFAVMDKVVEQWMSGTVGGSRGSGSDALYRYIKERNERFTETERRSLYARCLGLGQPVDEPQQNREFDALWIRFLSSVSVYARGSGTGRPEVTKEQVLTCARDLALNLSLHGTGLAHFAAIELQVHIRDIREALSQADVLAAYGVRDLFQLIERVSAMYLGGAAPSIRLRTMAHSGAAIIIWLAQKSPLLVVGAPAGLDFRAEADLTQQVERWLAVIGTPTDPGTPL